MTQKRWEVTMTVYQYFQGFNYVRDVLATTDAEAKEKALSQTALRFSKATIVHQKTEEK